jgi:hypothetical protein
MVGKNSWCRVQATFYSPHSKPRQTSQRWRQQQQHSSSCLQKYLREQIVTPLQGCRPALGTRARQPREPATFSHSQHRLGPSHAHLSLRPRSPTRVSYPSGKDRIWS